MSLTYTKPACHTPIALQPGFKVVRLRKGQMESVTGGPWRRLKYEVGKPLLPKENCGPLAVFESKRSAVAFCKSMKRPDSIFLNILGKDLCILPCLYAPSRFKSLWFSVGGASKSEARDFDFPPGTDMADAVLLQKAKP